uniref:Uncharacterized protein n=1 Tax=Oryza nivara TaxID=4536 RepID=A0A0E0G3W6_ORYNI
MARWAVAVAGTGVVGKGIKVRRRWGVSQHLQWNPPPSLPEWAAVLPGSTTATSRLLPCRTKRGDAGAKRIATGAREKTPSSVAHRSPPSAIGINVDCRPVLFGKRSEGGTTVATIHRKVASNARLVDLLRAATDPTMATVVESPSPHAAVIGASAVVQPVAHCVVTISNSNSTVQNNLGQEGSSVATDNNLLRCRKNGSNRRYTSTERLYGPCESARIEIEIEIEKCRSNLGIEIPEISVITESDVDPTGLCSAATVRDGIVSNSY